MSVWKLLAAIAVLNVLPQLGHTAMVMIDLGPGNTPANWNAPDGRRVIAGLVDVTGQPTGAAFNIRSPGTDFAVLPAPQTIPQSAVPLAQLDGNQYQFNGTFMATLSELVPGQTYNLYLFGLRSGAATRQNVTLTGADNVTFRQQAGDGELAVNDGVGDSRRPLTSYAKQVTASSRGTIDISIVGRGDQGRPYVVAGIGYEAVRPAGTTTAALAPSSSPAAPSVMAQPVASSAAASSEPYRHPIDKDRNILGLYLGMPLAEASAILKDQHPLEREPGIAEQDTGGYLGSRLRGHQFPWRVGFDWRGTAQVPGWKRIYAYASGPPKEGDVFLISRLDVFGEHMLWSEMEAALLEKYGPPTYNSGLQIANRTAFYVMSWSYNADGAPLTSKAAVDLCGGVAGVGTAGGEDNIATITMTSHEKYINYSRDCGRIMTYTMQSMTQRTEYISGYTGLLYDMPMIISRNKALVEFTAQEAEKIAAQKKAAAKGKRPTL